MAKFRILQRPHFMDATRPVYYAQERILWIWHDLQGYGATSESLSEVESFILKNVARPTVERKVVREYDFPNQ